MADPHWRTAIRRLIFQLARFKKHARAYISTQHGYVIAVAAGCLLPVCVILCLLFAINSNKRHQTEVLRAVRELADRSQTLEAKLGELVLHIERLETENMRRGAAIQSATDAWRDQLAELRAEQAERLEIEVKRLEGAVQSATDTLRQDLANLRAEQRRIEEFVKGYTTRRRAVAGLLRDNTVALGIRYLDTSGTEKLIWQGTGFSVKNSGWCITAGHVIEHLLNLRSDLGERELSPELVAKAHDGTLWSILETRIHPDCPAMGDRHKAAPSVYFSDIGAVKLDVNELAPPLGLEVRLADPITEIGEEIAVAGFPTEVNSIDYPRAANAPILPTIRFGRVERLSSFDTRASEPHQLIQHNIPLVGGNSGAPIVNLDGEVVGVTTVSSYRTINAEEVIRVENGMFRRKGNLRLLDAANINFAVSVSVLRQWLTDLSADVTSPAE